MTGATLLGLRSQQSCRRAVTILIASIVVVGFALGSCSSDREADGPSTGSSPATVESTSAAVTSAATTASSTPAPIMTGTTAATATTSTVLPDLLGMETIGTSAGGRPITALHRGTAGGTVVLVVGVIHGDEADGSAVIDRLRRIALPTGIDLWLLPVLNPDGLAGDQRGNANLVDLNRNFPHDWQPIDSPGSAEYSGTGPASEPETQAFIALASRIQPRLTLWYHQDLHRISPSSGADGELRRRYAELTGLDYLTVSGGRYTGVAATWVRTTVPSAMSFIIELGPSLTSDEAAAHAAAVLEVAGMAAGR